MVIKIRCFPGSPLYLSLDLTTARPFAEALLDLGLEQIVVGINVQITEHTSPGAELTISAADISTVVIPGMHITDTTKHCPILLILKQHIIFSNNLLI